MSSFIYNSCLWDAFRARIDFEGDTFRVVLLTDEYEPDKEAHKSRADLFGEVRGQGYAAGGMTVQVRAAMADDRLTLALGGLVLPEATVTAKYAVYCVESEEAEDGRLIACIDFGGDVTSTNGEWKLRDSSLRITN